MTTEERLAKFLERLDDHLWCPPGSAFSYEFRNECGWLVDKVRELLEAVGDLIEYARHNEGCSAPFGVKCKCRFDELMERLHGEYESDTPRRIEGSR